jgi:hypothetical protein
VCAQGFRSRGLAAGEFGLAVGEGLQRGVPLGLQAAGDQPVVRVDRAVAALGATGLIPCLLDLVAPLRQGWMSYMTPMCHPRTTGSPGRLLDTPTCANAVRHSLPRLTSASRDGSARP